jgi:hypothetical protein
VNPMTRSQQIGLLVLSCLLAAYVLAKLWFG